MKNTIALLEKMFLETSVFIDKNETNFFLFLFKQSSSQLSKISKNFLHTKIINNDINLASNSDLNNIFMNIVKQNSFDCFFNKTIDYIVYETNYLHKNANNLDGLTYFYYLLNIHRYKNTYLSSKHINYIINHSNLKHRDNRRHNAFGFIIESISYGLCQSVTKKIFDKLFNESDLKSKSINYTNNYIILLFHLHANRENIEKYFDNKICKNIINNIDRKTSSLFKESLASFDMLSNIDLYHHLKNELNQNISQKNIIKI